MMPFPRASGTGAFVAGISLSAPTYLLYLLKADGLSAYGVENPVIFAGIVIYGLLSLLVFVIDVRSLAPKALKTSIPWFSFPTDQAGWSYLFRLLGRILVWLLGIAAGAGLFAALQYWPRLF